MLGAVVTLTSVCDTALLVQKFTSVGGVTVRVDPYAGSRFMESDHASQQAEEPEAGSNTASGTALLPYRIQISVMDTGIGRSLIAKRSLDHVLGIPLC